MDRWTKKTLEEAIERVSEIAPKEVVNEEKYNYYLLLKMNGEFVILAMQKEKDIYIAKMRYNAPLAIQLTLHEYFEYSYIYYNGNCRYWNMPKNEATTKDNIKKLE